MQPNLIVQIHGRKNELSYCDQGLNLNVQLILPPCFLFVFVLPHHSTLASLCSNSIITSQPIPAHTLALSLLPDLLQRTILF